MGYNDKQVLYFVVCYVITDWKSSYTWLHIVLVEGNIASIFCFIF